MKGKKICSFQDRIYELVSSSGKSQTTIAAEFGIAKQTLSAWITGQNSPRTPVISALAEYFHVSLAWLMGFDVPREVPPSSVGLAEYVSERAPDPDPNEEYLISAYRSLSSHGQELLVDRAKELKLLYGKKSEGNTAQSV